jgi:hypothetical protein
LAIIFATALDAGAEAPPIRMKETIEFIAHEDFQHGRLFSCGWHFTTILNDDAYRRGGLVTLNGSLAMFYAQDKSLGWILKIRGFDISFGDSLSPKGEMFDFAYGYLIADSTILAHREAGKFRCEAGGFCAAYSKDATLILSAIQADKIQFAYSRTPTGIDVVSPLSWSALPQGEVELQKGHECLQRLLDRVKQQD